MRDDVPIPGDAVPSWRRRILDMLEFRPREALALGVVCLAIVAAAGFGYARSLPKGAAPVAGTGVGAPLPTATASGSGGPAIFVHIAGAVRNPGVYELRDGSRVVDGLTAAGGATPGADVSQINLARALADGERVYIPRRGEVIAPQAGTGGGDPGSGASGDAPGKVNLNTASVSQLEALPGIGQVIAQRIFDYRTQHGPFRSIRDLLKIEGIGEKKFDSIKDHVTV